MDGFSAKLLVEQHCEDPGVHAAMRADELLDVDDFDGQRVWLRIMSTVKEQLHGRDEEPLH